VDRRVYRSAWWLHCVWIFFALVGIFGLWRSFTFAAIEDAAFFRVALSGWLLMAAAIGANALRSRVVLDSEFVSVRGPFRERCLKREQVEDVRTGSAYIGRGGRMAYLILGTKGLPSEELKVDSYFRFDEVRDDWIGILKNLDDNQDEIQSLF
jgi:hypothetical protein